MEQTKVSIKKYGYALFLGLTIGIAFFLRMAQLDRFPAGFNADEANQGYSAFSILKTGRDEWGKFLPITPRSFGDFRAPLYMYLAVPSVAVFGLNVFATRFPGALFGSLSVVATYLLVIQLFKRGSVNKGLTVDGRVLGLVAALFLTISPWHIQLSRGAFESNLPTFFLPFGWWAFEKGLEKQRWMILASLSFGLGMFSYYSARFIIPIFIFLLIIGRRKLLLTGGIRRAISRYWLAGGLLVGILLLAASTMFFGGSARATDVAIFGPTGGWQTAFSTRHEGALLGEPQVLGKLFWNKLTYVWSLFISNYLTYFSPQFLFTQGAGEATYGMIPGVGVLYLPELVFIVLSIYVFVRNRLIKVYPYWVLLALVLLAPISAAMAKGPGLAANRTAIMMPFIQIFLAFGAVIAFNKLRGVIGSLWSAAIIGLFIFISFISFGERYLYHGPIVTAPQMSYGWEEATRYIKDIEQNYHEIIVSHEFTEPQIFVAFFFSENPVFFQNQSRDWLRYEAGGLKFVDQLGEYKLGNYTFRRINYKSDSQDEGTLLIGKGEELPVDNNLLKEIDYPDGRAAIRISRGVSLPKNGQ